MLKTTQSGNTAAGSKVAAGGDVIIKAAGAGADSNITVQGSDIRAGGNALLKADGSVNLLAASNTNEQYSDSSNQSVGVGAAVTYGKDGAAFGFTANAALGKGGSDGTDQSWSNSHVTAGKTVGIDSGGDTNIKGAVVSGNPVVADIGSNLDLRRGRHGRKLRCVKPAVLKRQRAPGTNPVYGWSRRAVNASRHEREGGRKCRIRQRREHRKHHISEYLLWRYEQSSLKCRYGARDGWNWVWRAGKYFYGMLPVYKQGAAALLQPENNAAPFLSNIFGGATQYGAILLA